ncbi:MAG: 30S ribosomal protein S15 [Candidatus Nealsonbacteria bacterium]|jgi:small subunit ribosomal protein S15|nr:30S ribosomal protein S15 [Candidatus Nealsonbacteria bacterium]
MLKKEDKEKLIKKHQQHEKDTGSSEVQIALLSEEISELLLHLKKNPKDFHSKKGLLKMVSKRKSLLGYLKKADEKKYNSLIKKIGLKK